MKILVMFFLVISFSSFAQEKTSLLANKDSITLYQKRYDMLKELYLKQLDSETHKKLASLTREFADKMNFYDKSKMNFKDLPSISLWIKDNFEQTDFKSMDEVTTEMEKIIAAQNEEMKENKKFYDYMTETVFMFGPQILSDALKEVIFAYPEKFNRSF